MAKPTHDHRGIRNDDEWEQDRMDAIARAFETGEMVTMSRDLPDDTPLQGKAGRTVGSALPPWPIGPVMRAWARLTRR